MKEERGKWLKGGYAMLASLVSSLVYDVVWYGR